MYENRQILRLNSAGHPIGWVNYQTAVRLYHLDQIAFECGASNIVIKGGTSRLTGPEKCNKYKFNYSNQESS